MRILTQPFGSTTLGAELNHRIDHMNGTGSIIRISVAYARATGVLRLASSFRRLRNRGGYIEVVVGVGRDTVTTQQALVTLREFANEVWAFNNPATTFHPKVYLLEESGYRAVAYVGSNNLTPGGLYTNYEAAIEVELDFANAEDQAIYRSLREIVDDAKSAHGRIVQIDSDDVVRQLIEDGYVEDESSVVGRQTRRQDQTGSSGEERHNLFPGALVPSSAPPLDESLLGMLPRPHRADVMGGAHPRVAETPVAEYGAEIRLEPGVEAFVMELDNRDTRQRTGYSSEIYIPIAAREENPTFWGWPRYYQPSPKAGHPEWRVSVLVRPAGGAKILARNKRLWYYDAKREFRFNNRELILGSTPGDLLVMYRRAGEYGGEPYEYEAAVIPAHDPLYGPLQAACVNAASEIKTWGYI